MLDRASNILLKMILNVSGQHSEERTDINPTSHPPHFFLITGLMQPPAAQYSKLTGEIELDVPYLRYISYILR